MKTCTGLDYLEGRVATTQKEYETRTDRLTNQRQQDEGELLIN